MCAALWLDGASNCGQLSDSIRSAQSWAKRVERLLKLPSPRDILLKFLVQICLLEFHSLAQLPGIMAFLIQKKVTPRIPSWLWPAFIVDLVAAYMFTKPCFYRKPLICLVLGLAIPFFTSITNRPLVAAGKLVAKYSYGLYLSHLFCIWFAFQKLGSLPMSLEIPIFFTSAVLLPIIGCHTIKDPCLKFGNRISDLKPRLGV